MAQVGMTVNAMVASMDMSMSSPYGHLPAAGNGPPAEQTDLFCYFVIDFSYAFSWVHPLIDGEYIAK